jgi:hypothetical protein
MLHPFAGLPDKSGWLGEGAVRNPDAGDCLSGRAHVCVLRLEERAATRFCSSATGQDHPRDGVSDDVKRRVIAYWADTDATRCPTDTPVVP